MKSLALTLFVSIILITQGCYKNERKPAINRGLTPDTLSVVDIKSLPGAALISYTLPEDENLLYVKAQYKAKDGIIRETKSSYYNQSIKVVGFGDTKPHEVKLFVVNEGENASKPVTVTIHPQTPAYLKVLDSIQAEKAFGGIKISFKNPTKGNIAIIVLANDTLGEFVPFNTFYTKLKKGSFTTRGFDSVMTTFGIFVRDRWNNISDTIRVQVKPLFEMRLDRTKMHEVGLPGDAPLGYSGQVKYLFDGNTGDNGPNGNHNYYHTSDEAVMPQWFTFSLGVKTKLSRMKWWMRKSTGDQLFYYGLHNPKIVEIWGSNDPPKDGSWDNWILLAKHTQVKPSGLPIGELSQDDIQAAEAGETVVFPLNTPPVKYIRFKTDEAWDGGTYVNFDELAFWGQPE